MANTCTICRHAERLAMEKALLAGGALRDIGRQYGVSKDALARHHGGHVTARLAKAAEGRERSQAGELLEYLDKLRSQTEQILAELRASRESALALKAIARLEKQTELVARLAGELREGAVINVNLTASAEWIQLRTKLLEALRRHPAALIDVKEAFGKWPAGTYELSPDKSPSSGTLVVK